MQKKSPCLTERDILKNSTAAGPPYKNLIAYTSSAGVYHTLCLWHLLSSAFILGNNTIPDFNLSTIFFINPESAGPWLLCPDRTCENVIRATPKERWPGSAIDIYACRLLPYSALESCCVQLDARAHGGSDDSTSDVLTLSCRRLSLDNCIY